MRIATPFLRATVAVAIGLAACGNPPTSAPQTPSFTTGAGVTMSATGGGNLLVTSPIPAIGEATFSFSAAQRPDGTAYGMFRMVRPRAGFIVDFAGEVTCVSVDPVNRRLWVGGVVTQNRSSDPNHLLAIHAVGRDVWFRVVDNGEGAGAAPDRSTVYGFEGGAGIITSAEYCARQLWTPGDVNTFALTEGNIQVRTR